MSLHPQERVIADAIYASAGCTYTAAAREAGGIIDALAESGWHLTRTEPLPSVAPSRGPRTSDDAAASITDLSDRHWCVLQALARIGPSTDEELADAYARLSHDHQNDFTPQSASSVRTRRHELAEAGHVYFTSLLRPTKTGRAARVWQVR